MDNGERESEAFHGLEMPKNNFKTLSSTVNGNQKVGVSSSIKINK